MNLLYFKGCLIDAHSRTFIYNFKISPIIECIIIIDLFVYALHPILYNTIEHVMIPRPITPGGQ